MANLRQPSPCDRSAETESGELVGGSARCSPYQLLTSVRSLKSVPRALIY